MATTYHRPFGWVGLFSTLPAFTTFTLNQSTDQWEVIFKADNDGQGNLTITQVGFRYGARTGTPPTYKISLQGVTNGVPDGTIKGGASPASVTFTPPADTTWNNGWRWLTLDNAYTAAPGEDLALVIAYSSGTIDASNCSSFTTTISNTANLNPFSINNDAGVRTVAGVTTTPIFGYATADRAYGRPLDSIATITYQSGSSPNEYGMKFTDPAGISDTYKIGCFVPMTAPAAAGTFLVQLYDGGNAGDTTVLQDVQHDTDNQSSNSAARPMIIPFNETSPTALTFGNSYRVSILAQTATNVLLYSLSVATASDWDAWPGGQNFMLTQRSGGNWTDTATSRLIAHMEVIDMTEAAGSAGIITPAGWGGGFN